jgi:DNA-3-methyladenine glycosylase I
MIRCAWCLGSELYENYHDKEWGRLALSDQVQFEFLVLESAQAGLNWLTVLKKRENYRAAYDGFNPELVSQYDEEKILELMGNAGLIRNRKKIEASIINARIFLEIVASFGSFANYLLSFNDGKPVINHWKALTEIPATSNLSDAISKDLKKKGCKFIGSTIIYAHLQATGIIMDHTVDCHCYQELTMKMEELK